MNCFMCDSGFNVTKRYPVIFDYPGQTPSRVPGFISESVFKQLKDLTEGIKRESKKTRIVHGQTLTIAQQRKKQYVDHRNKILGLH